MRLLQQRGWHSATCDAKSQYNHRYNTPLTARQRSGFSWSGMQLTGHGPLLDECNQTPFSVYG
jgi:hypothetical protein